MKSNWKTRYYAACVVATLAFCMQWTGVAQTSMSHDHLTFTHLTASEGLSHNTVRAIVRDRLGNMWMGTANGLCRYDGYGFRNYMGGDDNLADPSVYSLLVDTDGTLWIGTQSTLSCYDFQSTRFMNYSLPESFNSVHCIQQAGSELLIGMENGLARFRTSDGTFTIEPSFSGLNIRSLLCIGDSWLLGTSSGILRYFPGNARHAIHVDAFDSPDISTLLEDGQGGYWVGTYGDGLVHTDARLAPTAYYRKDSIRSDNVRVLRRDGKGHLFIGTYDGFSILDEDTGKAVNYFHNADNGSMSHNSVWSIYEDEESGLWIGTYMGGVNWHNRITDNFRRTDLRTDGAFGYVSCLAAENDRIWAGTNDDGIFALDPTTGKRQQYSSESLGKHISNNIKCILPDGTGCLWVGTHLGGLLYLNPDTGNIVQYDVNTKLPLLNGVYSIADNGDGTLSTGTLQGLYLFDKRTGKFSVHPAAVVEPLIASKEIMNLCRTPDGILWINTGTDIYRYDGSADSLTRPLSLETPRIGVMSLSRSGKIWVGTSDGLFSFNEMQGQFQLQYENGSPDMILGIMEDKDGNIWYTSDAGISCLHSGDHSLRNWGQADGVADNRFSSNALCTDSEGNIYFGGLSGITVFNPDAIVYNEYAPAPYVENISAFKGQMSSKGIYEIERTPLGTIGEARISAKNNVLNFSFSVSNMNSKGRNVFIYKLEGFDMRSYETTERDVTYSNLRPGRYRFTLKAANSDGRICDDMVSVPVRIVPEWYQTVWIRLLFVALLGLVAAMVVRSVYKRAKMRMRLKAEISEKLELEHLRKDTMDFFINMSRELRTPLTLMQAPLTEIEAYADTADSYISSRIGFMKRGAMRLMHIVNQMLGYRKIELGLIDINPRPADLDKLAGECFSLFEDEALKRDIDYIYDSKVEGKTFNIDPRTIRMILLNLLSNAFKYTPRGGVVRLAVSEEDVDIKITVTDSSTGLTKDKATHLFDNLYKSDEQVSASRIGLGIVAKLAGLQHGRVGVETNSEGNGIISVFIPANQSASETVPAGKTDAAEVKESIPYYLADSEFVGTEDGQDPVEDKESELILVAESDPVLRKYIVSCFENDFKVVAMGTGKQVLDFMKNSKPDILIADRNLPVVDGIKLCQTVKRNIQTSHIPVLIVGTNDELSEQQLALEAGADTYVPQPFTAAVLKAKIANFIKSRDRIRHHYSSNMDVDPASIASNSFDEDFLRRAKAVVEANIDNEAFSSNVFAESMNMSRSNLYLKITSITGESAVQFIRKIRFNKACQLLLEHRYTVAEISSMVGFSSPSYFSTSFKKYTGCLPTEYGKKQ